MKISKKEEIRQVLKLFYKKDTNPTQTANKICDVYGLHAYVRICKYLCPLIDYDTIQYVWHKSGSSGFNLENLI